MTLKFWARSFDRNILTAVAPITKVKTYERQQYNMMIMRCFLRKNKVWKCDLRPIRSKVSYGLQPAKFSFQDRFYLFLKRVSTPYVIFTLSIFLLDRLTISWCIFGASSLGWWSC